MPKAVSEWLLFIFVVLPIGTVVGLYVAAGLKAIVEMSIDELRN